MTKRLVIIGGAYYSYQTAIKQSIGGVTIGNVTQYKNSNGRNSRTTGRHQKLACVHSCSIKLDEVPVGCNNLIDVAISRGLITRPEEK